MKKSIIDHTYRDYSQTEITDLPDEDRQQTSEELFPAKLHRILNTPEYEDIIAWQPHGRVWKVKNKSVFVSYILPRHFQHSNYESFNRSVNGWGMKRLYQDGPDQKGYYHEMFLRGKIELTGGMHRLKNPGKRLPNKAGEPDFYEISRRYPLPPPPAPTISNSYINVQGDTRPTPKRQKTNHNNIVQQQPGMYNPYGYNPYMMGQQYPGMPGSPSQYNPHQQYHDANMMAYYAQLPYSDPSTIQQPPGQYPNFYPPAAGYGHYPGYPPPQPPHGYPPQPHPGYPPMSPMYPAHQQPPPPPAAAAAAAATAAAAAAQPQQPQQGSTGHAAQANAQQYETDDDKYEEEDGANDEHEDPRGHKIKGSTPVVHNRQPQANEEGADDERKPAARTDLTRASDQGGVAAHPGPSAGTSARPPYRSPTADYTREDPELTSFFREAAFGNSPPSRTAAPMQYGGGADPYHSYAQGTAQQHHAAAAPLDIGNYYLPPSSAERARGHAVQPYPTRDEAEQNEEHDPREHQEYQR